MSSDAAHWSFRAWRITFRCRASRGCSCIPTRECRLGCRRSPATIRAQRHAEYEWPLRPMQRLRQSCLWSARPVEESTPTGKRSRGPHHDARGTAGITRRRPHIWSGKRDLNPRPSPWQGDALPLSYSRSITVGQRGGVLLMRERSCQAI